MKKRTFSFDVPAVLMISVEAETEVQAWLQIEQKPNKQFSAVSYPDDEGDYFICTPKFEEAKLVGFECPPDEQ